MGYEKNKEELSCKITSNTSNIETLKVTLRSKLTAGKGKITHQHIW